MSQDRIQRFPAALFLKALLSMVLNSEDLKPVLHAEFTSGVLILTLWKSRMAILK